MHCKRLKELEILRNGCVFGRNVAAFFWAFFFQYRGNFDVFEWFLSCFVLCCLVLSCVGGAGIGCYFSGVLEIGVGIVFEIILGVFRLG